MPGCTAVAKSSQISAETFKVQQCMSTQCLPCPQISSVPKDKGKKWQCSETVLLLCYHWLALLWRLLHRCGLQPVEALHLHQPDSMNPVAAGCSAGHDGTHPDGSWKHQPQWPTAWPCSTPDHGSSTSQRQHALCLNLRPWLPLQHSPHACIQAWPLPKQCRESLSRLAETQSQAALLQGSLAAQSWVMGLQRYVHPEV